MIKIQPSGDYVQLIYVDPVQQSVQQELRSDTDAFEVSYDSDGKLFMQFGAMRFENPDPTDFIINGSPVTDAADFISKLNALFTGGGGGGGSSLLPTTGTGTATGDIAGDLDGHQVSIGEFGDDSSAVVINKPTKNGYNIEISSSGNKKGKVIVTAEGGGFGTAFLGGEGSGANSTASVYVSGSDEDNDGYIEYTAIHHEFNLVEYADNAAAISGGLEPNDLYHTAGTVKIVV